jgi:hypothetical protein
MVNQMVNSVGFTVSSKQLALQIAAAPILSPRRPLPTAAPRRDPLFDLVVGDRFAAIERRDRSFDAGNLPLVDVEIRVDRLGREQRTAAAGARGQRSRRFLATALTRTVKVVERMTSILYVRLCKI